VSSRADLSCVTFGRHLDSCVVWGGLRVVGRVGRVGGGGLRWGLGGFGWFVVVMRWCLRVVRCSGRSADGGTIAR